MLRNTAPSKKRTTFQNSNRDKFLKILLKGTKNEVDKLVQDLAKRDNPTLQSIMKIEHLFKENIEFDSRSQLLRKLDGSMKASSLNTIIARLVSDNKIIVNDDHSLTWIVTEGNMKLNKEFDTAIPFLDAVDNFSNISYLKDTIINLILKIRKEFSVRIFLFNQYLV